ncbi:glutathione S-transferase N-terminal domain-containing protein [Paludibacterium denitrificans]|uniref:glutathione S-transferase N-terminal domain-containing protein n=1 Tax=Paludibacterium denitrificans TaxID=2675226 RepID=UPI001E5DF4CA|nr:glutathione S-transferase N-terminal domain-containing protein [Paludibacterium denitrificans]
MLNEPFLEQLIPLFQPETKARIQAISPSGKVPVLLDNQQRIWDTLAICEYRPNASPLRDYGPMMLPTGLRHARSAPKCTPALPPCAPTCR